MQNAYNNIISDSFYSSIFDFLQETKIFRMS